MTRYLPAEWPSRVSQPAIASRAPHRVAGFFAPLLPRIRVRHAVRKSSVRAPRAFVERRAACAPGLELAERRKRRRPFPRDTRRSGQDATASQIRVDEFYAVRRQLIFANLI